MSMSSLGIIFIHTALLVVGMDMILILQLHGYGKIIILVGLLIHVIVLKVIIAKVITMNVVWSVVALATGVLVISRKFALLWL